VNKIVRECRIWYFRTQTLQEVVLETVETTYIPIATIEHSDLEFSIPEHSDSYIDPNIHIYVSGQLLVSDVKA
jgi:hypothetical protein